MADSNRGQLNLTVDGNALGGLLNEYWPSAFYPLSDFGPITFAAPGDHTLRLTVAGKSAASSNYTLTADKFLLAPQ